MHACARREEYTYILTYYFGAGTFSLVILLIGEPPEKEKVGIAATWPDMRNARLSWGVIEKLCFFENVYA